MSIMFNSIEGKVFLGKFAPAKIAMGTTKEMAFGYRDSNKISNFLKLPYTYNHTCGLKISGVTEEVGIGDKSPDNPFELKSTEAFNLRMMSKNSIRNGRFENGMQHWMVNTFGDVSISNNVLNYEVNSLSTHSNWLFANSTNSSFYTEHKFFIKFHVMPPHNTNFRIWPGTTAGIYEDTVANQWNEIAVVTFGGLDSSRSFRVSANINTAGYSTGEVIQFKDFLVIDMGKDNSNPLYNFTIEEMNELFSVYSDYEEKSIHFPYTLKSLPNGVADYIEIDNIEKTAKLIQYIESKTLVGDENWITWERVKNLGFRLPNFFANIKNPLSFDDGRNQRFSHFKSNFGNAYDGIPGYASIMGQAPTICVTEEQINGSTVSALKSWLNTQYNLGTPVVFCGELNSPIETVLDYDEVTTYYPYTSIYADAVISPMLTAKYLTYK